MSNVKIGKGIYFLGNDNVVVYIGKSQKDIFNRICGHIKDDDKIFTQIAYYAIENEADINILELILIDKYKPLYNRDSKTASESSITVDYNSMLPEPTIISTEKFKDKYLKKVATLNETTMSTLSMPTVTKPVKPEQILDTSINSYTQEKLLYAFDTILEENTPPNKTIKDFNGGNIQCLVNSNKLVLHYGILNLVLKTEIQYK